MSKIQVTEKNWGDFEQAVNQRLTEPVEIEVFKQYNVWDFLGDIGFEYTGPQGIRAVRNNLIPKILAKIPDAKFKVTIWENAFVFEFPELWQKACCEAKAAVYYGNPHAFNNVPVVKF